MAKFITGHELNSEIQKLFEKATEKLILISPFVKLHHSYKSALLKRKSDDKLSIIVVFGKNENSPSRSISNEDIEFFKQFPNIEIRYEKRLHAKYYANEFSAIITSMNLYEYSQNNNIESGIYMEQSFIRGFAENLDDQAYAYFDTVIEQSDLLYHNKPNRKDVFLGTKYIGSTVEVDQLNSFFNNDNTFPKKQPATKFSAQNNNGYCIVTRKSIAFNINQPMNDKDYKAWQKKKDPKFKGSFCHFSGEKAETSFEKPILGKNWKKAKEIHGL